MKYNADIHHRRSIRLKGYDYSRNGAYFITVCAQDRECVFGKIVNGGIYLNDAGEMVDRQWNELPNRFRNVRLGEYIVMPNHFHGIIFIVGTPPVGAPLVGAPNNGAPNNGAPHANAGNTIPGAPTAFRAPTTFRAPTAFRAPTTFRAPTRGAPTVTGWTATNTVVGGIIGAFKSITTNEYIRGVKTDFWQPFDGKLWQRNYYEHVIGNENELNRIKQYIIDNPSKWKTDRNNLDLREPAEKI
ncbi:MAG: transposase [Candidatus Falkowbacteria bacterium]